MKVEDTCTEILRILTTSVETFEKKQMKKIFGDDWFDTEPKPGHMEEKKKCQESTQRLIDFMNVEIDEKTSRTFTIKREKKSQMSGHRSIKDNVYFPEVLDLNYLAQEGSINPKYENIPTLLDLNDGNKLIMPDSERRQYFEHILEEVEKSFFCVKRLHIYIIGKFLGIQIYQLLSVWEEMRKQRTLGRLKGKKTQAKIKEVRRQMERVVGHEDASMISDMDIMLDLKLWRALKTKNNEINPYNYLKKWCRHCEEFFCVRHYMYIQSLIAEVTNDPDYQKFGACDYKFLTKEYYTKALESVDERDKKIDYSCSDIKNCYKNPEAEPLEGVLKEFQIELLKIYSRMGVDNHCLVAAALGLKDFCFMICEKRKEIDVMIENELNAQDLDELVSHPTCCYQISDSNRTKRNKITHSCLSGSLCLRQHPNPRKGTKQYRGCSCVECEDNCPCIKMKTQCDPSLCKCTVKYPYTFGRRMSKITGTEFKSCQNNAIVHHYTPRLGLAQSNLCEELGLFALEDLKKGQHVGIYKGEFMDEENLTLRDNISMVLGTSYVFEMGNETFGMDSLVYGNKPKFVNHGKEPFSNITIVFQRKGQVQNIVFIANRDIKRSEELLFDYGDQYQLDWTVIDNSVTELLIEVLKSKKAKKIATSRRSKSKSARKSIGKSAQKYIR